MRYVAAYLLAVIGGKASPTQNDIEKILSSVGIEADAEKLKKVIASLEGKSIEELIAEGRSKLSSMPVGGGGAAAAAAPAAAAPAAEEKKEDKKAAKEDSESDDDDMGFGLFD
ncbi:60S acidic ribosomal protein P2 [Cotesia glomerata]|uniref:60S acidic ribosomal protein P2 n=1 Tax=Cotesia glomerata TaxID=32391 RepID=UPI001D004376|nr:60S acidic ribosomal protein P2 [Cotesia glomerata]